MESSNNFIPNYVKSEFIAEICYAYRAVFQGIPRDSIGTCRMFKVELGIHVLITVIIDSLAC